MMAKKSMSPKDVVQSLVTRMDDGVKALHAVRLVNLEKRRMLTFMSSLIADVVRSSDVPARAGVLNVDLETIAMTGMSGQILQQNHGKKDDNDDDGRKNKTKVWVSGASHQVMETPVVRVISMNAQIDVDERFIIVVANVKLLPFNDNGTTNDGDHNDFSKSKKTNDISMLLSLCVRDAPTISWTSVVKCVGKNGTFSSMEEEEEREEDIEENDQSQIHRLYASIPLADAMSITTQLDDIVVDTWVDVSDGRSQYIGQFTVGSLFPYVNDNNNSNENNKQQISSEQNINDEHHDIVYFMLKGSKISTFDPAQHINFLAGGGGRSQIRRLFRHGEDTSCMTVHVRDGIQLRCIAARLQKAIELYNGNHDFNIKIIPPLLAHTLQPIDRVLKVIRYETDMLTNIAGRGDSIGFTCPQSREAMKAQLETDEAFGIAAQLQLELE